MAIGVGGFMGIGIDIMVHVIDIVVGGYMMGG
jgi:hypothetical protein